MTQKTIEDFINLYKVSQTLQFSLIPQGRTRQNMEALLSHDQEKADAYQATKTFLDQGHVALLERTLENIAERLKALQEKSPKAYPRLINNDDINWLPLDDAINHEADYGKEKSEEVKQEYCKLLAELFRFDPMYESLVKNATPNDFFTQQLDENQNLRDDEKKLLNTFKRFACYFKGYQENRRNIYSSEAQNTAAPHRAIYVNFLKMKQCVTIYNHIKACYPEVLDTAAKELGDMLNGQSLDDIFSISSYSHYLSQKGIDYFNQILGGKSTEDQQKIKGINECINLYSQTHEDARKDRHFASMPSLFKQILSDRTSVSFIPQMFQNDHEVLETINALNKQLSDFSTNTNPHLNVIQAFHDCLKKMDFDKGIWVGSDSLNEISQHVCGSWSIIPEAMENWAETHFKTKAQRNQWLKKDSFSLDALNALELHKETEYGTVSYNLLEFWQGPHAEEAFQKYETSHEAYVKMSLSTPTSPLKERKQDVQVIKEYLDALMGIMHLGKPLYGQQALSCNEQFYASFNPLFEQLKLVVSLYNRVRNYLTQKPGSLKKIKLMFDAPTLADGWDQNKESANKTIILIKEGKYYLGILPPKSKVDFDKLSCPPDTTEPTYQKMVYKYLPGPNKMLPKVFLCTKGLKTYTPPEDLLAQYKSKIHLKGSPNFSLDYCHQLIDFFKESISKHPDWKHFNFHFSPTKTYKGIDEFYHEISEQGYRINFVSLSAAKINDLVETGNLLLFQIYNKDFAPGAHGTPDKFTLYWKSLFSPENLVDIVMKLNGEAELFWRKASIQHPFVHQKHTRLVNRTYKENDDNGNKIVRHMSEQVHKLIDDYVNNRNQAILEKGHEDALKIYQCMKNDIKEASHDIIKDRRFTRDTFSFHVPICINFKAADQPSQFNVSVIDFLKDNPDMKIIGIDRGERNLLTYSLIDQQGTILEQGSWNLVQGPQDDQIDYHGLLDAREKERDEARRSWDTIGKIKDLKSGYLSQIVHKITRMMVEKHAIVVLEDLNVGFKRGRFAIEKQVYQDFERALITKLNYLVFKEIQDYSQPGSVLRGYQLTNQFTSFEKLGKQSGFLFYVPAGFTSKIDPTTGFVNLFNTRKCTNKDSRKEFLLAFDSIKYDASRDSFAFAFNYDNFKTKPASWKKDWTVYSAAARIVYDAKNKRTVTVNPTQNIKEALKTRGCELVDNFNLLQYLKEVGNNALSNELFYQIFKALEQTLQMRNSSASQGKDYIQSPVLNKDNQFFTTSTTNTCLPQDADTNGAYHIALKGLYLIQQKFNQGKTDLTIKHQDWFEYVQKRNL